MIDRLRARLAAVLPTLRALGQWLALAGLTGLACGGAGAAFTWCVAKAAALRAAHPWLLFLMPLAGLAIVFSYRAAGLENDSGTKPILALIHISEPTRPAVISYAVLCFEK